MIFTSVDLPAPFSPIRAWMEPSCDVMVPERRATTAPNDLTTLESSSAGGAGVDPSVSHEHVLLLEVKMLDA